MRAPVDWLLDGEAFIRYRTRRDLMDMPEEDPAVVADRRAMVSDPRVRSLVFELLGWPGPAINSHKSAGQFFHKLAFLADLGLRSDDPEMPPLLERVMTLRSTEGPFAPAMNVGKASGEIGESQAAWALCDTPLIEYALLCFGLSNHPAVRSAGAYLMHLGRIGVSTDRLGWPCVVSASLGGWRGPGKKEDPCPFATLAMLKMASQVSEWRDAAETRAGAETLLGLWSDSLTQHPYIFYMGDDFRKLKAPFIWYDLLHVLDVLVRFPWLRGDGRLKEMLDQLAAKGDAAGRFSAESVWQPWSGWEFGQKKRPSRWITLLAYRILRRSE